MMEYSIPDIAENILILDDQAESSAQLFNFDVYSEAIAKIIQSSDTKTPLVIGIYGDWGSGKTSLMRTVEKKINTLMFMGDLKKSGSLIDKLRDDKNPFSKYLMKNFSSLNKFLEKSTLFLFTWDEIQGPDNQKLLNYLKWNMGLQWTRHYRYSYAEVKIKKSDSTITVSSAGNSISLELNDTRTELTILYKDQSKKLPVYVKNGRLFIYDRFTASAFESLRSDFADELKHLLSDNKQELEQYKDHSLTTIITRLRGANGMLLVEKSREIKDLLNTYGQYEAFHIALVQELNHFLHNTHTFNKDTIEILKSIDRYAMPEQKPRTKEDFIHFNRLLLEKAYPDEIMPVQKNGSGESTDSEIKTIWFNAWKYDKEDVLWRALVMRILDELKNPETQMPVKRNLMETIRKIPSRIGRKIRSPQFYLEDIDDFEDFFYKLFDKSNPLSRYIVDNLSSYTKEQLELYAGYGPHTKEVMKRVIQEMNPLLKDVNLFDEQRFSEVYLTPETRNETQKLHGPTGKIRDIISLNYKLLNGAYREENLNKKIEDLEDSLYQEVYREEPGNLEFKPGKFIGKLLGGSVKLGLSAQNPLNVPSALKDFSESIQRTKRIEHVQKIQFKEQFQYRFEKIIRTYYINKNKRAVIFIDDLDRCLPEKALEILEAIKTFMDVEGCIFVIGIDKRVISYIIRQKYKEIIEKGDKTEEQIFINGENYLEKIIQLSFQLPPIENDDLKEFINNLNVSGEEFYKPYLGMITQGIQANPRKIKRFFNLIELQRKLADAIKHKNTFFDEKMDIYDSLMILWAIISSNHYKFRDAVVSDATILRQTIFQVLEELKSEQSRDEPSELPSELPHERPAKQSHEEASQQPQEEPVQKPHGRPSELYEDIPVMNELSKDELNLLNNLINEFKIYVKTNWEINSVDEQKLDTIIRQVISLGQGEAEKKIDDKQGEKEKENEEKVELGFDDINLAIKNKLSLKGKNLTILSKEQHGGLNFSNMDLTGADLTGAYLKEAKFVRSKLNKAKLEGANLENAKLNNAKLSYANLRGANLNEASLKDAELLNADLTSATLIRANLYNAGLIRVTIEGTDFSEAKLIQVNLKSSFFNEETNLENADIDTVTIDNLRGSNWEATAKWDDARKEEIAKKYA